jgi:hypothetical protein
MYLIKDTINGETLRLENLFARTGWKKPTVVPGQPFFILMAGQTTGYVLQASNNPADYYRLELESADVPLSLDDLFLEGQVEVMSGSNIINMVTATAYPSKVDTSDTVLFTLQEPINITSGNTYKVLGTYFNPTTGLQCNAKSAINPVANTDYKGWTNKDETGTDFTAALVVTPTFYADSFECIIYAGSGANGWLTRFQIRGKGIYMENPISAEAMDEASIAKYGEQFYTLDMKYQRTTGLGQGVANSVVELHKDEALDLKAVSFNANSSINGMVAMLESDIGYLLDLSSVQGNVSGRFYINKIQLSLSPGDVYNVRISVDRFESISAGDFTPIAVEFGGESVKHSVSFGHVGYLANLPMRTLSAWIYPITDVATVQPNFIMGFFSDNAAYQFYLGNTSLAFAQKYAPSGQAFWNTPGFTAPPGMWTHVVVCKDLTYDNPPIFYINGVQRAAALVVGSNAVAGQLAYTEDGVSFNLGNTKTATVDNMYGFRGMIADARVYNRAITPTEAQTLYNGGIIDVSKVTDTSLLFQAPSVKTNKLNLFVDQPLTGMKLFDNILRLVGNVTGSPTGRSL